MELATEDGFASDLAVLTPAPKFHTPTFGDDVANFAHDLGQPGLGNTGATFRASAASALENDIGFGISDDYMLAREYAPVVEALNKVQQRQPDGWFSKGNRVVNPAQFMDSQMPSDYVAAGGTRAGYFDWFWGQVEQERQRNPGVFGQLPKDHADALAGVRAEQRTAAEYAQLLQRGGGPITGTVAGFAGGAAGGMADPLNLAASVVGFPAAEGLLKTALIEGAGNAAVTLAGLPARAQHYEDIGLPMSGGEMAGEVAASGLLGAGFGVGGKLLARVLGLNGHALVDEFHAQVPEPSPTLRTAAAMAEDHANIVETNPFKADAEGVDLHRQALEQTQAALNNREPAMLPDYSDHVDAAARSIAPEAFAEFEAAATQHARLREQIDALGAARADLPEVEQYQDRVNDILHKVNGIEDRLTNAAAERLAVARNALQERLSSDTPQMAFLRKQLQAADYRMRDAGPLVAAARRAAKIDVPEGGVSTPSGGHFLAAQVEANADHLQHRRVHDPEALKPYSEPVKKPVGFHEQSAALARELSPPPEKPASETPKPAGEKKSPYGDASAQIEALDRMDGADLFADPGTGKTGTVKSAVAEIKRQARAVERLRGCVEGKS